MDEPAGGELQPAEPAPERDEWAAFDKVARVFNAALTVGLFLWLLDVGTNGAVSRMAEPYVAAGRRRLAELHDAIEHEREVRRAARHVIFDAMTIAQEAAQSE